jgi:hypothetical protein
VECPDHGEFPVTGLNTVVYRWRHAHPSRGERRAVSWCPVCDTHVGQRVGPEVAAVLLAQGAKPVEFRRPGELDDPSRRARRTRLTIDEVYDAVVWLADNVQVRRAMELLAERHLS